MKLFDAIRKLWRELHVCEECRERPKWAFGVCESCLLRERAQQAAKKERAEAARQFRIERLKEEMRDAGIWR